MNSATPVAIGKAYDLYLWLSERTARFPRTRKFTLGERLENVALDILMALIEARYEPSIRATRLKEANLNLEKARFLVRAARDLRFLSVDQYEFASRAINEVGRMVGGWRKSGGREEKS